ncbi:serine-rich and transmembrane domain-containing protein 1 isoform X2 [Mesocricetus auratus]|uniref:Serine-rich and transmembrane domain-containing protein 1 isoform X2 n=1 Tax=Mesocricetus auratus TaxID=10036 RepID=A0ABM2Y9R2_MESAU|nr:serine-rich and transmembrane domain-containing protein 1 isoform X2 [Mesocricetus auratus]
MSVSPGHSSGELRRSSVPSWGVATRTLTAAVALCCVPLSLLTCLRVAANPDKFFPAPNTSVSRQSVLWFFEKQLRAHSWLSLKKLGASLCGQLVPDAASAGRPRPVCCADWCSSLWFLLPPPWKSNAGFTSPEPGVRLLSALKSRPHPLFVEMSGAEPSSGFAGGVENGTFLELFPTSLSTSVDASSGHLSNVYIYVFIFLSLLAFLLLLLIIALQRLKNIISSSSSYPEYPSDAGSSFTNLEVCSISSQRSTFSNLSS